MGVKTEGKSSTDTVYKSIREKIIKGVYKPSEKLPELGLSKEFKASRNTIRNALFLLQKDNLVEIEKNKGAKVKSFNLEEVKNHLEIRKALEGIIIKSSINSFDEKSLKQLEETLNAMAECIKKHNLQDYSELNKKFHNLIYQASTNQEAVRMVSIIKTQLIRFHIRTILIPGRNDSSFKEHERIFNAIKNKDIEEAEQAIKDHINNVCKTIVDYYQFLI